METCGYSGGGVWYYPLSSLVAGCRGVVDRCPVVRCVNPRLGLKVLRRLAAGVADDIIDGFGHVASSYAMLALASRRVAELLGSRDVRLSLGDCVSIVDALLEVGRLLYAMRVTLYRLLEDAVGAPLKPPYDDIVEEWPGSDLYILARRLYQLYESVSNRLEEHSAKTLLRTIAKLIEAYARIARSTEDSVTLPCYGRLRLGSAATVRQEVEQKLARARRPLSDEKVGEGIKAVMG